uniref:Uncharacterized protein n=1 Tax=Malurus cyaneus samueli TaxID=2593467 RepID=A0A8C5TMZ2_9PASS
PRPLPPPPSQTAPPGRAGRAADPRHPRADPSAGGHRGHRAPGPALRARRSLRRSVLGRIWQLSDVDRDGMLDHEEFALAGHLIGAKLEGRGLPTDLPPRLVPDSQTPPAIWCRRLRGA